jgi:cold shock CspA family protein/ribosome-associated translation inhibitor RaiA
VTIEPVITFRNLDPPPEIEVLIRKRAATLERFAPRILGCDVAVDAPQKRKVNGRVMHVRVTAQVPGPDITTEAHVAQGSARDDLVLAVNRAFSAAERKLRHQKTRMAGLEVKHHPPVLHGEITSLEPELGYGHLRADDGREVYFQRDGLTADVWDDLARGTRLRFREEQGEKGPYATGITPAG